MSTWRNRAGGFFSPRQELADECETYLSGRFLERTRGRQGAHRLEPWMWLNAVSHASLARVRELSTQGGLVGVGGKWYDVRASIATEVLRRCAGDERELAHLQRSVLVPLEQRLMHYPDASPAEVSDMVLVELTASGP